MNVPPANAIVVSYETVQLRRHGRFQVVWKIMVQHKITNKKTIGQIPLGS